MTSSFEKPNTNPSVLSMRVMSTSAPSSSTSVLVSSSPPKPAPRTTTRAGMAASELLGDVPVRVVRLDVVARLLALGEHGLVTGDLDVRDPRQHVGDDVEPRPLLVIGHGDVPRREVGVGRGEHLVARP